MCAASVDGGTTRADRFPAPLDPAYARLDERSFEQLAAMTRRYATLLNFYDLTGTAASDWSAFFANDITFLLADICSCPAHPDTDEVIEHSAALDEDMLLLAPIRRLAGQIDGWYRRALEHDARLLEHQVSPITLTLRTVIGQDLAPRVSQIAAAPRYARVWERLDRAAPLMALWNDGAPHTAPPAPLDLRTILGNFEGAVDRLTRAARHYLVQSLTRSDHLPHATLLLAFLGLYRCVQADMNQFTARHLDYYYESILGLAAAPAQPDEAVVVFTLQPSAAPLVLPAGTQLDAGKNADGSAIVFATERDLTLNQAAIGALCTVFVDSDDSGVLSVQAAPVANSADGLGAPLLDPAAGWSTFGAATNAPDATLGFVLASPALLLSGGTRQVTLVLSFADAGEAINTYVAAVQASYEGGHAPDMNAVLNDAFTLSISGASGWMPVAPFTFGPLAGSADWALAFTLDPGAPALLANPALAPADDGWPMLRLLLNPEARAYAYSPLAALSLCALRVEVSVSGLQDAQLAIDIGPVPAGKPFPPFGSVPRVGAALTIAHPELAAKRADRATVTVLWQNLPTEPGGFATTYQGYAPYDFSCAAFACAGYAWNGSVWLAQAKPFPLFAQDARTVLQPASQFAFTLPAATGALRIALSAPSYAFGASLYPTLFAQAAIENAQLIRDSKKKPAPQIPMPAVPFVPMASAVLLDYHATDHIALTQEAAEPGAGRFYQIGPFGYAQADSQPGLFPNVEGRGCLMIGIANAAPGQLVNLYFRLLPVAGSACEVDPAAARDALPRIRWSCLDGNRWRVLDGANVVSGTAELTGSGLVSLAIPVSIDGAGTVMAGAPGALIWLMASTESDPAAYCDTLAILPQAGMAKRVLSTGAVPAFPLAAGSIAKLCQSVAAIKSVAQPWDSSGGAAAETENQFRARVCGRLRHKQRASQPRDYEEILLDQFADLAQVRCIGPNQSRGYASECQVQPGRIVLAVMPSFGAAPDAATPFDGATLAAMADAVAPLASPAIEQLTVRNVRFEYLRVFVSVSLQPGSDAGICQQQLNDALVQRLSPWLREAAPRLDIGGGAVALTELASVVRAQPYVAAQGPLRVAQSWVEGQTHRLLWWSEGDTLTPAAPWGVLAPVAQHAIVVDGAGQPLDPAPEGIGSMRIGSEFTVETDSQPPAGPAPADTRRYVLAVGPVAGTQGTPA
jgi:hypothetical protein